MFLKENKQKAEAKSIRRYQKNNRKMVDEAYGDGIYYAVVAKIVSDEFINQVKSLLNEEIRNVSYYYNKTAYNDIREELANRVNVKARFEFANMKLKFQYLDGQELPGQTIFEKIGKTPLMRGYCLTFTDKGRTRVLHVFPSEFTFGDRIEKNDKCYVIPGKTIDEGLDGIYITRAFDAETD